LRYSSLAMKAIVLAGGQGTRLWPLSRKNYPKQFLKINGEASLLQETVRRLLHVMTPDDIVLMTNTDYQFHVQADLIDDLGRAVSENLVLEPCSRNTAPALALAAVFCVDRLGCSHDEVLFVSPADHIIRPVEAFATGVRRAAEIAAEGRIVTFGIEPTAPNTAYGYIKRGERLGPDYYRAERFVEKPNRQTARAYLQSGDYSWNSGMFAFPIGLLLEELGRHAPEIHAIVENGYEEACARFADMPNISIDYAVMEQSEHVVTLPTEIYWNDIGSWDSFFEVMGKDEHGNLQLGDVITRDTNDSLVMSDKRLIATIGLRNLLVVETDDAILIAQRKDAQKVKEVVDELRQRGRTEASEHLTTYRPWGHYTVLGRGQRYQIKHVLVNPGKQLSLQMHHHRSEHWVVVCGTARVTVDDKERFVHENESVYIPKTATHRLANPGRLPLELIEVQNGEYVGEDDIVRFADEYGRQTTER
jgi:mannose-1-phosphate guanylyltransferase / mannose-6-phosphate isomerase